MTVVFQYGKAHCDVKVTSKCWIKEILTYLSFGYLFIFLSSFLPERIFNDGFISFNNKHYKLGVV